MTRPPIGSRVLVNRGTAGQYTGTIVPTSRRLPPGQVNVMDDSGSIATLGLSQLEVVYTPGDRP